MKIKSLLAIAVTLFATTACQKAQLPTGAGQPMMMRQSVSRPMAATAARSNNPSQPGAPVAIKDYLPEFKAGMNWRYIGENVSQNAHATLSLSIQSVSAKDITVWVGLISDGIAAGRPVSIPKGADTNNRFLHLVYEAFGLVNPAAPLPNVFHQACQPIQPSPGPVPGPIPGGRSSRCGYLFNPPSTDVQDIASLLIQGNLNAPASSQLHTAHSAPYGLVAVIARINDPASPKVTLQAFTPSR